MSRTKASSEGWKAIGDWEFRPKMRRASASSSRFIRPSRRLRIARVAAAADPAAAGVEAAAAKKIETKPSRTPTQRKKTR